MVLTASILVFTAGLLLLTWSTYWAPKRRWGRLRPRFIDWVTLAVESDRRDAAYVEEVTRDVIDLASPLDPHR